MINVVESGQKNLPKLVMLHGLGGTLRYWNTGINQLTEKYHVIRLDLLGFGDSKQPWQNYTIDKHLAAIETVLLNYDSFTLLGHSLGAAISLAYAERHQTQVEKLILMSLPLFYCQRHAYNWMRRTPSGWLMTNVGVAAITCMLTRRLAKKILPRFIKNFPKEVMDDLVKHNVFSSTTTLWNVLYNQKMLSNIESLNKNLKVHCIHAKNDSTAPYEPVKKLADSLPNWEILTLEESDHHPWLWDNEACIKIINNVMKAKC